MIRTLVSIEVDLASSMAIRYACQLGNLIPMELQPVYVKGYPFEEPVTGIGWVRHTWEKELVKEGKEEISEMIAAEMDTCPVLQEPRVIFGDREKELAHLMETEPFDLYVEGAPFPFTPTTVAKRLQLKFYQHLTCPFIWLRILRPIHKVLVLCLEPTGTAALGQALEKLWAGCNVPLHLGVPSEATPAIKEAVATLQVSLTKAGCQTTPEPSLSLQMADLPAARQLDFGLTALALPRALKKDHPLLPWLSQIKTPLLVTLT
jgi:hypothetical protein